MDAYTAKKIVPRVVVTIILINLSIYLVALSIDITNVIGAGISRLIAAPFGDIDFQMQNVAGGLGSISTLIAGLAVVKFFGPLMSFLLVFVGIPAIFAIIGVLVTLILRQALILFLTISAPIAIALYVLPNTEKYAKAWFNLLLKTLLVYPIIMIVFTLSRITPKLLGQTDPNTVQGVVIGFMSLIALVLPLFIIPFAFKLAGGAIGALYATLSGWNKRGHQAILGNPNDPNSLRNRTRHNLASEAIKQRAQFVRQNRNRRGIRGVAGKAMNFGHVMAREAEINKEGADRVDVTTNFGDDTLERARASIPLYRTALGTKTVDINQAERDAGGNAIRWTDAEGNAMRMSLNGQKEFTDYDYRKASRTYRTMGEMQEAVWYEGKKARDLEHAEAFQDNYGIWAEQEGLTPEQALGLFTGVGFKQQAKRKEWKYSKAKRTPTGSIRIERPHESLSTFVDAVDANNNPTGEVVKTEGNADGLVSEAYSDMGSWAQSQEGDSMFRELGRIKDAYATTLRRLAPQVASGTASVTEQAEYNNTVAQLAKIQSMEESLVGDPQQSRGARPPAGVTDEEGTPGYTGLSGAPQAVIDEARRIAWRTATTSTGETVSVKRRFDNQGNLQPMNVRVQVGTDPATGRPIYRNENV